jgi:hypothetical protein
MLVKPAVMLVQPVDRWRNLITSCAGTNYALPPMNRTASAGINSLPPVTSPRDPCEVRLGLQRRPLYAGIFWSWGAHFTRRIWKRCPHSCCAIGPPQLKTRYARRAP